MYKAKDKSKGRLRLLRAKCTETVTISIFRTEQVTKPAQRGSWCAGLQASAESGNTVVQNANILERSVEGERHVGDRTHGTSEVLTSG